MTRSLYVRCWLPALLCSFCVLVVRVHAADAPPAPVSSLNGLVKRLADKRLAEKARQPAMAKADLFRPEFRFKRAKTWLLLPELARHLGSNAEERAALQELLETGVGEASRLLSAEGADNDIAAAGSLVIAQLWSFARQSEIPEPGADRLHAQMVAVLAGPETAAMSDTDKQRYWEYCLGFSVFLAGMQEIATEPEAQTLLRTLAGSVFKELMGVSPELIDIGADGITLSAAAEKVLGHQTTPTPRSPAAAKAVATNQKSPAPPAFDRDPTHTDTGISGLSYTAPTGWTKEEAGWATIYRATLPDVDQNGKVDPTGTGQHACAIFVLPPRAIFGNAQATFESVYREQFDAFEIGDSIVHYRSRLPSGLVAHYMGRYFQRKTPADLQSYAVLYLVDLGAGRVQPITAVVQPSDPGYGMSTFKEQAGFRALAGPLAAFLDSVRPVGGPSPYPSGGYFRAEDLRGDWGRSYQGFGGTYYNSMTGASAGVAVNSSAVSLRLGEDGTYAFSLGYYASSPVTGTSTGSTKHHGRYRLNGDIVLIDPAVPLDSPFSCCAVGVGTRQTEKGPKRMLVTVMAASDGKFAAPPLVPVADSYSGIMYWYVEK